MLNATFDHYKDSKTVALSSNIFSILRFQYYSQYLLNSKMASSFLPLQEVARSTERDFLTWMKKKRANSTESSSHDDWPQICWILMLNPHLSPQFEYLGLILFFFYCQFHHLLKILKPSATSQLGSGLLDMLPILKSPLKLGSLGSSTLFVFRWTPSLSK